MPENSMSATNQSRLCRELALLLTERLSVTGSGDEASFGPWLASALRGRRDFGPDPEIWTFPVSEGDARHVVAMLIRKGGRRTVVQTGHYDTVTVADYGDLAPLATRPEALLAALTPRLAAARPGTAEARARDDFATGLYLPGRGLLDMKAGLAAGLAAIASLLSDPALAQGNLLFLAVPDEENASAGARAAAARLAEIAGERGLDIAAVINLDAIADDGDGSDGRVVALGTVGKVLPTAFVVGVPVHSGFPLRGINAAVLAAAIVRRMEWAPELTDDSAGMPGTPVSLLSLRDGKTGYDVTTPGTAFATWNVLSHRRDPAEILDIVVALTREAVAECLADMKLRATRSGQQVGMIAAAPEVPVLRYGALLAEVRALQPSIDNDLDASARNLRGSGLSLPDQCHALTAELWSRARRSGPAVILGLGSIPYLASELDDPGVRDAVEAVVAQAPQAHGIGLRAVEYFAGISDMSFFGQVRAASLKALARDTPGWASLVGLAPGGLPVMPTVNLGPWGRDYHTPLERIETEYGFNILPGLLCDLTLRILSR